MSPDEEDWFEQPGRYRIEMAGRWDLSDLYELPHAFEQCYSFIYCFDADVTPLRPQRIATALRDFPWRGGFSYINIYSVLKAEIAWRDRPRISGIKYASPGWIELALNLDVAVQVAKAVAALAATGAIAVKSYSLAYKYLADLKLSREKNKVAHLKITKEQDVALFALCNEHAKFLGFSSVRSLVQQTGNSEVTLRLLLAHHRRLRGMVEFVNNEKATFPENQD